MKTPLFEYLKIKKYHHQYQTEYHPFKEKENSSPTNLPQNQTF